MKLNCVIIDDEPMARKLLTEYIGETDFLNLIGLAENPLKATPLLANPDVDLVFLDINMPKMTGLELLKSSTNLPMVIFTTAYGQYALEGFEMAVVDYLVKPFSLERFLKSAGRALELKNLRLRKSMPGQPDAQHIYVKCNSKLERIAYDELLYIEAMANYITLYTTRGKFIVYLTIKGIMENLPPENFVQVHKGIIVNAGKVRSIEGNMLHIGDSTVTISASFHGEAMGRILKDRFLKR